MKNQKQINTYLFKADPKGKDCLAIDSDGTSWLLADVIGNPFDVFLCIGFDNAPYCHIGKKLYVCSQWAKQELIERNNGNKEVLTILNRLFDHVISKLVKDVLASKEGGNS
jgi:hypothetical protein